MPTHDKNVEFDAAAIAPVRYGTPEMEALLAAIGESAAASKAAGKNPFPAIDLVRDSRLGALRVPVDEGGGGCTLREYFAMLMDLAAADSDVAQILRVHFWFTEERLRTPDGTVRQRWLSRIVAGKIFGNAFTEIGTREKAGSFAMQTRLEPVDAGYRLNGTKYFCTGSLFSDWVLVAASTPEGKITNVVVPCDRAGVTFEDDWDGVGQRFTGSGTGRFENVAVAQEEVLRQTKSANIVVDETPLPTNTYLGGQFLQLILTAIVVGNMRNVVADAIRLVRTRKRTFTHASADTAAADPQFQEMVGRLSSSTLAAEATVLAAAEAQGLALDSADTGQIGFELAHRASLLSAQAKVFIDEVAPRAASLMYELGGASSTLRTTGLDEHWRNIVTLSSHNPAAFKARAIGDYLVNGTKLPTNLYF